MNKRARTILIAFALVMIVALIAGIINIIVNMQNTGKYGVSIVTVPKTANLVVDGKPANPGIVHLTPGDHSVTASKEGFKSETRKFTVKSDDVPYIGITLIAQTEAAKDSLKTIEEQQNLEAISGQLTNEYAEDAYEKTPILSELPYLGEGLEFRVDFGMPADPERGERGIRALLVSAPTPESRQKALQWIRSLGQDPSNYEIVFSDYQGPIKDSGGEKYDEHR